MSKKENKLLGIMAPLELHKEIQLRAERMQISKSAYGLAVLQKWIKSGKKLEITEK